MSSILYAFVLGSQKKLSVQHVASQSSSIEYLTLLVAADFRTRTSSAVSDCKEINRLEDFKLLKSALADNKTRSLLFQMQVATDPQPISSLTTLKKTVRPRLRKSL